MRERKQPEKRWRIAMVAPCAFPSARGSQVLIREVAEALAERGHEVHVVTYPSGEHVVPLRGIHVHRIAVRLLGRVRLPWLIHKALLDLILVRHLLRIVREQSIDVIHAHNYEGPLVAFLTRWRTGVPIVYHSHNALADELPTYVAKRWRGLARRVGRLLDHQVPRRSDHAIALTPELEGFLRANGVAAQAVTVIPPFPPAAIVDDGQAVPGVDLTGRFAVVYTGNLDPYQDLDVLLRGVLSARTQAPDICLVLVTHDAHWRESLGAELAAAVDRVGATVTVVPSFPAVRRLMARAQALVCPRSSWSGYPIKLLNYLAAGRPIIAAAGSAKELIDGDTALIIPNGDAEALGEAIVRLRNTPALAQVLGEAARERAARAPSASETARGIERIYETVAGAGGAGRTKGSGRLMKFPGARELLGKPRGRISALPEHRAGEIVRRTGSLARIAIALLCLQLVACAGRNVPTASLPPLDAPLPAAPGQTGPYRIQPGDLLRVKFMYHPELDVKVPVRPDGGVTLQGGGNIHAAGLTTEELEKVIVERTSDRLREPEVSVMIAQTADLKVYVMGEVRLPGIVAFREGLTPLQAIADRGGFSDTARLDSVLRLSPAESEYQGTRLDFTQPLEAGSPEGVQMSAGDVLYVPRTFIGDVNSFVRLYVRGLLPIEPRIGASTSF